MLETKQSFAKQSKKPNAVSRIGVCISFCSSTVLAGKGFERILMYFTSRIERDEICRGDVAYQQETGVERL